MTDPYQILGVSRDATNDEIKKAYRELARKYHPDNYVNNPLADLAQEKMKSINQAYDQINKERENGGNSSYGADYSDSSNRQTDNAQGGNAEFAAVRRLISAGQIAQAEAMLDAMSDRSAEWYFLKGSVCFAKGWYDEARKNYQTACSMNPTNPEYRTALLRMQSMNGTFGGHTAGSDECCDLCSTLICVNCLCDSLRFNFCC